MLLLLTSACGTVPKPTDDQLQALAITAVATDRDQIHNVCETSVPRFTVDSASVTQRGIHNTREQYWLTRLRTYGTYRCAPQEDSSTHVFAADVDIRAFQDFTGHWVSYGPQFVASGM